MFVFEDDDLWFFLQNSLKDTITVGKDWMIHTSPWANIMGNPKWPADITNLTKTWHQNTTSEPLINEEHTSDDGSTNSDDESDDDHVEISISDVEVEEDEVDD